MASKVLITSALPYANGSLHVGHLVEYIQTDVFVRFLRLSGIDVVYACADDAHGAPIEIASSKQGITPEQLIAKYNEEHVKDFNDFLISFDIYYSTHSKENKEYSDFFFNTLKKNGHIYERMVDQTYCEKDKRYLPDRFVKGTCPKCKAEEQYGDQCEKCNSVYKPIDLIEPHCTICGAEPVRKTSTHYFFRLSKFSDKLKKYLDENKNIQSDVKNFVYNWIREGLEDWDITRDGPYFGFKVPGETNKYYYVWLDAPIGYIAASDKYAKDTLKKDAAIFWKSDAEIIHFIGKDIIYFHLLFWPAMLMGVGYTLPSDIVVHGHLTINGEKMSKSRGNFFTAREYLDKYDPELLRFYYTANMSKNTADLNLDFLDFQGKINNELVSNIANFVYRTLNFINNNFDSKIGKIAKSDSVFAATLQAKFSDVLKHYEAYNYREAVKAILEISSLGNKFLQDNEPWKLINADKDRCQEIMALSASIVKNLSILLAPVMPAFSHKIQKQLGLGNLAFKDLNFGLENRRINHARILLTNLEEVPQLGTEKFPANIRVAEVESVAEHPNADKLYVLQINLGNEKRQLVAGLREFYTPEQLQQRRILVVTNLKHANIRGQESQGMLLAADSNGKVELLAAPKAGPGDQIAAEGLESSESEITIDRFLSLKLSVEGKRVFFGDHQLKSSKDDVVVNAEDGAKIR